MGIFFFFLTIEIKASMLFQVNGIYIFRKGKKRMSVFPSIASGRGTRSLLKTSSIRSIFVYRTPYRSRVSSAPVYTL